MCINWLGNVYQVPMLNVSSIDDLQPATRPFQGGWKSRINSFEIETGFSSRLNGNLDHQMFFLKYNYAMFLDDCTIS